MQTINRRRGAISQLQVRLFLLCFLFSFHSSGDTVYWAEYQLREQQGVFQTDVPVDNQCKSVRVNIREPFKEPDPRTLTLLHVHYLVGLRYVISVVTQCFGDNIRQISVDPSSLSCAMIVNTTMEMPSSTNRWSSSFQQEINWKYHKLLIIHITIMWSIHSWCQP